MSIDHLLPNSPSNKVRQLRANLLPTIDDPGYKAALTEILELAEKQIKAEAVITIGMINSSHGFEAFIERYGNRFYLPPQHIAEKVRWQVRALKCILLGHPGPGPQP